MPVSYGYGIDWTYIILVLPFVLILTNVFPA